MRTARPRLERQRGRLTMLATGSRGDVQPQVALAMRLQQAGYQVRFATHRSFAALVGVGGLEHAILSGDSEKFFGGIGGIALREKLRQPGAASFVENVLGPFIRRFLAECIEISRDAQAVLYWPPSLVGPSLSERLGIPCIGVATYPLPHCRTRAFPNPWNPVSEGSLEGSSAGNLECGERSTPGRGRAGSGAANERSWAAGEETLWTRLFHQEVARWRCQQLGLAEQSPEEERRRLRRLPHLLGFSPEVLPRPRDWPSRMHVTGYWFLDLASGFEPPPELLDFLAAGEPPVAIGFGSMAARDPRAMTEMAVEALGRAGRRGILLTGWGGLRRLDLPPSVFQITAVPHDWLFPRVAAVVHHGGSGTTAATLRAGAPSLIVPFGFDQPLWAARLKTLGAAVDPIPQGELDAGNLAAAIRALTTDPRPRERAAALARALAAEDGPGQAVALVDRYIGVSGVSPASVASVSSASEPAGSLARRRA
ncbi:MAG TPA: glycosyltransferase [Thermoanaerobaculia bacterium]|nr:glycosyltransferase [Thermoanaerobaculia bacterium]